MISDDDFAPWAQWARTILRLIHPGDLETFLLYAFSRKPNDRGAIRESLVALPLESWQQAAGIQRALLWLGIAEYTTSDEPVIRACHAKFKKAWSIFLRL